eukprot:scaffold779_cov205-Alexandrium_tamarense.AAC.4
MTTVPIPNKICCNKSVRKSYYGTLTKATQLLLVPLATTLRSQSAPVEDCPEAEELLSSMTNSIGQFSAAEVFPSPYLLPMSASSSASTTVPPSLERTAAEAAAAIQHEQQSLHPPPNSAVPHSRQPPSHPTTLPLPAAAVQQQRQRQTANRVSLSPISMPRKYQNPMVNNPYKKDPPSSSTTNANGCVRAERNFNTTTMSTKQKFIEKYRLQAMHHSHRYGNASRRRILQHGNSRNGDRGEGGRNSNNSLFVVQSYSAMELYRKHESWRSWWRKHYKNQNLQQEKTTKENAPPSRGCGMKLMRPRLFLFSRCSGGGGSNEQSVPIGQSTPHHQQQPNEGIWELGTGITELSGEGGSGKTQISLSLCATTAMTPLINDNNSQGATHCTSIYITMGEGIPSSKIAMRLEQMVRARRENMHEQCNNAHKVNISNNGNFFNTGREEEEIKQILSRIWLLSIRNEEEFIELVESHLPQMLEQQRQYQQQLQQQTAMNNHNHHHQNEQQPADPISSARIGIIAFDGIAGFFRFSDPLLSFTTSKSSNSLFHRQRSSKLFQISSHLRRLSDVYDIPMLITNQVTASIAEGGGDGGGVVASTQEHGVVPALGLIWSNCVTTRYILQRKEATVATGANPTINYDGKDGSENGTKGGKQSNDNVVTRRLRKALVFQSINMPEEKCVWFVIDTEGVVVP